MYDKITIHVPYMRHDTGSVNKLQARRWLKVYKDEYFPRLYSFQDYEGTPRLKIECSVAKILYGNNLLEVTSDLLEKGTLALQKKLEKMEIDIPFETLWGESSIVGLEICKNWWLNEVPSEVVINYLRKFPPPRSRMKLEDAVYTQGKYRIDSCRFAGEIHEVAFYNKTQELQDHKHWGLEWWYQMPQKPSILRFEVRLKKEGLYTFTGKTPSLKDLANLKDGLYTEVLKKYWDPFVKFGKYMPIYVSAEDQLARIENELTTQQYTNLLAFKSLVEKEGVDYARTYFKRHMPGKAAAIWNCFKQHPVLDAVQPRYSILDKVDKILYNPHWWLNPEDIFNPNPEPFSFQNSLIEDFWTTKESADYLGICERVVQRKCKEGEIPSRMINRKYRLRKGDVMDYAYAHYMGTKGD